MWSNIGKVEDHQHSMEFLPSISQHGSSEDLQKMSGHKEAMIIFADCTSSMKGLFSGVLLFTLSMAVLVIHFVLNDSFDNENVSDLIASVAEWVLYSMMLIVTIFAYVKIAKLEVNPHPVSLLGMLRKNLKKHPILIVSNNLTNQRPETKILTNGIKVF